ncbi:MAG TPA: hypothetical protein VF532_02480 [Candidatus Angelobacter sp.]
MTRISISLAFMLFAIAGVRAQTTPVSETRTPAPETLTLTQLAAAAKTYVRDSAEFPLKMQLSMVAMNSSGQTIKRDHATGNYDFHGYNPRAETGNAHMSVQTDGIFHSAKGMLPTAWNSAMAGLLPFMVLSKNVEEQYSLKMADFPGNNLLLAVLTPLPGPCPGLKWSAKNNIPESYCGPSKFGLVKEDLSLQEFSFEASGLPLSAEVKPFGRCEILRYHSEVEFQKVTLPDDPKPFVVPKHVEVTVETDKGKLIMISDFAPRK